MTSTPAMPFRDSGLWPASNGPEESKFEAWDTLEAGIPFEQTRPAPGLVAMVESEIIPRLMLAHRSAPAPLVQPLDTEPHLGPDTTEAFARMVVTRDPESLISFVGKLLQAGASMDSIYTDLLVPAAHRLGEYWDEDSASFTDVTIGLGRLQQVVRAMGWKTAGNGDSKNFTRSAFFAPGPGDQHVFGLYIVEDFFRRAGWRTWVETSSTRQDLTDTVKGHWFDVFGLSVGNDTDTDEVADTIQAIRDASRNPQIFVMVGGRLFIDNPELVSVVAADATALSGGEALLVANHALLVSEGQLSAPAHGAQAL